MSVLDRLMARLRAEEGMRSFRYLDSLGHATIGYGYLLEGHAVETMRALLGLSLTQAETIAAGAQAITLEQAEKLLEYTAGSALTDAGDVVGRETWASLPDDARLVLADMCFQLGDGGVRCFVHMLTAIRMGDFGRAAAEMRDSAWHKQTPGRCEQLAELMEHCADPPDADA